MVPVIGELAAARHRLLGGHHQGVGRRSALDAGAMLVNDVSGGMADPEMAAMVADAGVPWILMHWRGPSEVMQDLARYDDVVAEVRAELLARVEAAVAAGVDERALILDPGIGFAKNADHNWAVLRRLDVLIDLGFPVLIGASRKRFLGELLTGPDGSLRGAAEREDATAAVSAMAALDGVWGLRVHEPRPTRDALAVLEAYHRPSAPTSVEGAPDEGGGDG